MSWWVSLNKDDHPVPVTRFADGGTFVLGGSEEADLNITYNYSRFYYRHLDKEQGLRWLHGKTARDTIERLTFAVIRLGLTPNPNYWEPTKGNAGTALNILLQWAEENPDAEWEVC